MREDTDALYSLKIIGRVHREGKRTWLRIKSPYRPALSGLEDFSHIQVLWWFHRTDAIPQRSMLAFDPPFEAPRLGIFASRAPMRPNPIGLSTIRLLTIDRAEGILEVTGLDADDGSPVIDLKPYLPMYDRVADPNVPSWASDWPEWVPEVAEGTGPHPINRQEE